MLACFFGLVISASIGSASQWDKHVDPWDGRPRGAWRHWWESRANIGDSTAIGSHSTLSPSKSGWVSILTQGYRSNSNWKRSSYRIAALYGSCQKSPAFIVYSGFGGENIVESISTDLPICMQRQHTIAHLLAFDSRPFLYYFKLVDIYPELALGVFWVIYASRQSLGCRCSALSTCSEYQIGRHNAPGE